MRTRSIDASSRYVESLPELERALERTDVLLIGDKEEVAHLVEMWVRADLFREPLDPR